MPALRGWESPDRGVLFVISGPSGVGKSTLVKAAMADIPGLEFSVSATTRDPRAGEKNGIDYHFLSRAEFDAALADNAFLEHATVYDRSYGTLAAQVDHALSAGRSVVLDIDVQGARQVKSRRADAVLVMVVPPDIDALETRLRSRATDSDEVVSRRMAQVRSQLDAVGEYDYVVVNDDLDSAHRVFQGVLLAELSRLGRRGTVAERIRRACQSFDR